MSTNYFLFSRRKKNQKQMQLLMCAVCAYDKGKKPICKWHVIHYTRLHNFVSLANGIPSWQPPYHVRKVMYSILDSVSVSGIPSPLTVSQRQQRICYICHLQLHRFASILCLSAAERMEINFTINCANEIRFEIDWPKTYSRMAIVC